MPDANHLRQVIAKAKSKNLRLMRDHDQLAKRRGKYIWMPYVSLNQRREEELRARSLNDILSQFGDPAQLLSPGNPEREFWLKLSKEINKPAK